MNVLDYYINPEILAYIKSFASRIRNAEDREDCHQEIFAELYDYMPLDTDEAKQIIKRVAVRFERSAASLAENEISLDDAGII